MTQTELTRLAELQETYPQFRYNKAQELWARVVARNEPVEGLLGMALIGLNIYAAIELRAIEPWGLILFSLLFYASLLGGCLLSNLDGDVPSGERVEVEEWTRRQEFYRLRCKFWDTHSLWKSVVDLKKS